MEGMTVKADMDRISGSQRMPLMSYEEFTKLTSAGNRAAAAVCGKYFINLPAVFLEDTFSNAVCDKAYCIPIEDWSFTRRVYVI